MEKVITKTFRFVFGATPESQKSFSVSIPYPVTKVVSTVTGATSESVYDIYKLSSDLIDNECLGYVSEHEILALVSTPHTYTFSSPRQIQSNNYKLTVSDEKTIENATVIVTLTFYG